MKAGSRVLQLHPGCTRPLGLLAQHPLRGPKGYELGTDPLGQKLLEEQLERLRVHPLGVVYLAKERDAR